nr:hypothetical protein [Geodermatophilaceae bacterium]
ELLAAEAREKGVPLLLAPFQLYARLAEVLGSADVLLVLLEPDASEFSVPSKALSYLCAARPVLGLVPPTNAIARILNSAGGLVLPPVEDSIDAAANWILSVTRNAGRAHELGVTARSLAESDFSTEPIVTRFQDVPLDAQRGRRPGSNADMRRALVQNA